MLLLILSTVIVASLLAGFIYYWLPGGKIATGGTFLKVPTLSLELALRQYDDFLVYIHCQHQTILSAVKCFAEGTEWPCIMVGSAFEGCCLPRNLHRWGECATQFDFLVCLPTPKAGESTGNTLQYLQQNGRPHQVILKLSDPSIIFSDYILGASDSTVSNLRGCCHFLHECSDGFYLKKSFMETIEGKIKNSLGKVLAQKPGGMEMVARDSEENCTGPCPSLHASFVKAINERLDMLPLDPDTWSGDAMTNAQMLWVNLTNWSTQFWPARTFNVYPAFQCEWPEDAKIMWLERDRFWPSEAIVQEIAESYCYLLPLWNNSRNNHLANKEIMELQITFGTSEYLLFSETGPKERQCVVIVKALIEKHSLNFQILSSFVIKTVLFWYLQSIPLSQRQGLGRGELLVRLLDNLICFLNEKNLRHFFIPSVNLLDSFDSAEISNTLRDVKKVRRELLDHLSELFQLEGSKRLNEDFVRRFANQRTLRHLELEKALFKYDNFVLLNMTQHKLIFEAVKEERIISQLRRCVLPVGSMFEGSHIAECPSDGGISQEMDFMLVLPDVTASERDDGVLQCCSVEGPNPGYVNLKVLDATRITLEDTPVMQDIIRDPMAMFYEVHNDELFLSHKFVRVFERRVEYAVTMVMGTKFASARGFELGMKRKSVADLYPVMTIFFKEPIHCLIWPDSTTWPDCALGALFDTLSTIQGRQRDISWQNQIIDIAPAILCDIPVNVKNSWLKRKRCWPCQSIVEKISTLPCYLLAKPHPFTSNKLLEWRFSFSSAELLLSSAIKPWEKQCLMVLKALRRKYLQEPKVIASYHLKTVLFHVLESLPRRKRESLSRGVFLEKLLDQMINCVKSKNLPNFFIPENNMFRHCEDTDLSTVVLKLQDMNENLLAYLTEDLFTTSVTEDREEREFQETYWGVI